MFHPQNISHFTVYSLSSSGDALMLGPLEVRFVGDEDVMGHVVEKQQGLQPWCRDVVQTLGSVRIKPEPAECDQESAESVNERGYLLGLGAADAGTCDGLSGLGAQQTLEKRRRSLSLSLSLSLSPAVLTDNPQINSLRGCLWVVVVFTCKHSHYTLQ
uniref:Uncharacterized protein n=1 Tax=Callorhinchus milii TaxID=7868 RepID=A0A4W3GY49_CALMI